MGKRRSVNGLGVQGPERPGDVEGAMNSNDHRVYLRHLSIPAKMLD